MIPDTLHSAPIVKAIEEWEETAVEDGKLDRGELTLVIAPTRLQDTCRYLKEKHGFLRLSGITAVDHLPENPRFEVVYHLHSVSNNERLRLKSLLPEENPEIDSVTGVWRGAAWYEREIYDLFGVKFRGHPNLRRILLPAGWEGHPLRKDYPIDGYKYSYREK
jgi:NADH-quinone oxidoreductase subunit C